MNRPERLRASDVAYSSIRQGLAAGRWAPGSHLRESELAAELGISRTPVREALRKLASEQLVSFEPHLGVRVPGWSNHDIEEIFALRVELESYAAGQAARHATPAQVAELRELAGQIEKAAFGGPEPDYVRITELNNRFHALIVAAAANQRLVSLVVQLVEIPLVVRTFTRFDRQELARSVSHHYDLVEAIDGRNADWAVAVMRAHIHAGRQVMLRMSAGGDDEVLIEVTDARPRGQLSQAASVLADDYNADDAVGYGFAVPPHLLQPLPRFRIDLHLPLAVSQAPHGLLERELGRNQGAALLGDFDLRHRSRNVSGPVLAARAAIARPGEVSQLNRSNLFCDERRIRP